MPSCSEWRRMVEDVFYDEGLRDFTWTPTNGSHRRAGGMITLAGGRQVTLTVLVSCSPSDRKAAIHRVRSNLRTAIRNARRL